MEQAQRHSILHHVGTESNEQRAVAHLLLVRGKHAV